MFISATIVSIALQRAFQKEQNRKPCYLFVDEFGSFATADSYSIILSETRKYNLYLIALTQSITQLSTLKDLILNNTGVKIVGSNGFPALKAHANDLGIAYAGLQYLPPYHFFVKNSHYPAKQIKVPDYLLKSPKRYFMNVGQLKELKKKMISESGLYRDIDPTPSKKQN
ncbi:TraM recognition domain-containing protein [Chryseobacterium limigenitum]|uniref:TraM recognition domain-containing protein n=1 Tax=Chryseobacterium limigenitum TaxID=1612149 RepID=UPI0009FB4692